MISGQSGVIPYQCKTSHDFATCLNTETAFFNNVFAPIMKSYGLKVVFVHPSSVAFAGSLIKRVFNSLQKNGDIDAIYDDGVTNTAISLKVRNIDYSDIFFETVSNTIKKTPGWGIYSQADKIWYAMRQVSHFDDDYRIIIFSPTVIRELNLSVYPIKYGKTTIESSIAYRTEGVVIPLSDFPHTSLIHFVVRIEPAEWYSLVLSLNAFKNVKEFINKLKHRPKETK